MNSVRAVIAALLWIAAAQEPPALPLAPIAVQSFVQQALQGRLSARDIPDFNVVGDPLQIILRSEMPRAKQRLSKDAVPESSTFAIVTIMSSADAQVLANDRNQDLGILIVDLPQINGDNASVLMGADVVIHHQTERHAIKTCCCERRAQFRREEEKWVFVKWMEFSCS